MDRSEGGYNPKLVFEAARHRGSRGGLLPGAFRRIAPRPVADVPVRPEMNKGSALSG